MTFKDRVKLISDYKKWLEEENSKNDFKITDSLESFIAFLEIKGLLKEYHQKAIS